jgi:hypothetical protein
MDNICFQRREIKCFLLRNRNSSLRPNRALFTQGSVWPTKIMSRIPDNYTSVIMEVFEDAAAGWDSCGRIGNHLGGRFELRGIVGLELPAVRLLSRGVPAFAVNRELQAAGA